MCHYFAARQRLANFVVKNSALILRGTPHCNLHTLHECALYEKVARKTASASKANLLPMAYRFAGIDTDIKEGFRLLLLCLGKVFVIFPVFYIYTRNRL